jgi:hypothetical protein
MEKSWASTCSCPLSDGWKYKIGQSLSRPARAKCENLSPKITRRKRAAGMTQVIEYLPSKYKAMISNPSTVKKNQIVIKLHNSVYKHLIVEIKANENV